MDRPIKWILINDEIRLSNCIFHRDLLRKNDNYFAVKGGGVVEVDNENKTFIFKGESDEFGGVSKEDFYEVLEDNKPDLYRTLWMVLAMRGVDVKEKTFEDYKLTFIK